MYPYLLSFEDMQIKAQAVHELSSVEIPSGRFNIDVTVYQQVILLTGQVPSAQIKAQLIDKLAHIAGVRWVYDELSVGEVHSLAGYAYDSWLTTKVKQALLQADVDSFDFKVVTENQVVYLLAPAGVMDGVLAAKAVSRVAGVKKVVKIFVPTRHNDLPYTS